jgi:hypothetical protein
VAPTAVEVTESPTNDAVASAPIERLVILSPTDGAAVTTEVLMVSGMGPPDARIVRDVTLGFDDETTSDGTGSWSMPVELDEGPNLLVFRVGDEEGTSTSLTVTYTLPSEPEPTAEPESTEEPPVAQPQPDFATIEDGTWFVGEDVRPGTYRLREPASLCYWARLKGFGGSLNDIIANGNVSDYGVVTIRPSDQGFETAGCGTWSKDLSQVTSSKVRFGEGTFIVGTDLRPGTYRSSGGDLCYWARLRDFRGQLGSIIANDFGEGRTIVTIKSSDEGFESTGCGEWVRR